MSGHGPNASFDVVASARRRWSQEDREAILSEASNGVSVSEVARRHGLSRELLFRWRRELRVKVARANAGERFIPVALPAPAASGDGRIEIVLGAGRRVIVSKDADLVLLKQVIAILEERPVCRSLGEGR